MRCRLATLILFVGLLMLFAGLLSMNVLAAPAPAPFALLDIGPPPKGWDTEKHRDSEIGHLTSPHGMVLYVWAEPEVKELKSIVGQKGVASWLSKNLEVRQNGLGSRLRLTFRAGNRTEQVAILNSLLRVYLQLYGEKLQRMEKTLRSREEGFTQLVKAIESRENPGQFERNRRALKNLQGNLSFYRSEVARLKQMAAIRWAK